MEPVSYNSKSKGRILTGLFLVAAGILWLSYKMGAPIPGWIFSWPMALIALGVFISIGNKFQSPGGVFLVLFGGLNLADQLQPDLNFKTYIAPLCIIVLGLFFIMRPRGSCRRRRAWGNRFNEGKDAPILIAEDEEQKDNPDYIDSVSVFGGVKKNVFSKNFRGGEITCFMGGAEFNLTQADIQGQVVLEVTQVFGGTKLIVPAHWQIKTEVVTVFGGIEDKRPLQAGNTSYDKELILIGTTVFGGIDIRSY